MANSTTSKQLVKELASLRKKVRQVEATQTRLTEQVASQMSRTFKNAPVGLCYFDTQLRFVQINEFLAAINGLPAEELIGKSVREVLPEIAAAGVEQELRGVLESGDPVVRSTVIAATPAHPEEEHTFMHDYYAIRSDDGEIIGVGCCVLDITDLRRAQQARDEPIREIETLNRIAMDRELRMLDLEREINELCAQLGIKPRYDLSLDENTDVDCQTKLSKPL